MTLYIPTFADPFELERERTEQDRLFSQNLYIDAKTKAAECGEQGVKTIHARDNHWEESQSIGLDGTVKTKHAHRGADMMSWDFSPGWQERRIKHVRGLRAEGKKFDPDLRVVHDDGRIENVYACGMFDLLWFEKGLCCVRCRNWKSEDAGEHRRQHHKLRSIVSIEPPAGVSIHDMCGFCGNRLDLQKFSNDDNAADAA